MLLLTASLAALLGAGYRFVLLLWAARTGQVANPDRLPIALRLSGCLTALGAVGLSAWFWVFGI
jgi:hypothetical protein